ncbi:hypothetical protein [Ruegeria sp. HKCCD6604]|uniref:hypothetical protein n=1 Tax=Ruegeria sp. HKCCD6604 TaxID=2683000 RepID=UPI0014925070|nr:hypothetical protein [Ruegeria sp. HKCCD6604]NOC94480.1 hypothetical protein [Ruegeria sp. HKCCD6604]
MNIACKVLRITLLALSISGLPVASSANGAISLAPADSGAMQSAGPVILGEDFAVFSNGEKLDLSFVPENKFGSDDLDYTTKIYHFTTSKSGLGLPFDDCGQLDQGHIGLVRSKNAENEKFLRLVFSSATAPLDFFESVCADFLFLEPELPDVGPEGEEITGKWEVQSKTDPNGNPYFAMGIPADKKWDRTGEYPYLGARCSGDKTEAFIYFGEKPVLSGEAAMVVWEVENGAKKVEFWPIAQSKSAVFVSGWAGNFLKNLAGKKRVAINLAEQGKRDFDLNFDIRGIDKVLPKLASACNWSY